MKALAMTTTDYAAAGPARFKQGMRSLVGSVTVVAMQGHAGTLMGVTATAVCSLSAEPPSLIACINKTSLLSEGLKKGAGFSVSVLADGQQDVAEAFGGQKGVAGRNRFVYGAWHRSEHDIPLLDGARVVFECRVADFMDYGTHRAAIGLVTDVHLGDADLRGLAYGNGRFIAVE